MYNGNYEVASLVYIYIYIYVYVCSKTIFSPVIKIASRCVPTISHELAYSLIFWLIGLQTYFGILASLKYHHAASRPSHELTYSQRSTCRLFVYYLGFVSPGSAVCLLSGFRLAWLIGLHNLAA